MPANSADYQRDYRVRRQHAQHATQTKPVKGCELCIQEVELAKPPAGVITKARARELESRPLYEPGHQHTFRQTGAAWKKSALPEVECLDCTWRGPKGSNVYTDGYPDSPQLIQGLSTKQQGELLEKFPKTARRT